MTEEVSIARFMAKTKVVGDEHVEGTGALSRVDQRSGLGSRIGLRMLMLSDGYCAGSSFLEILRSTSGGCHHEAPGLSNNGMIGL